MKASPSSQRWKQIMRLLDEVIDLSPENRAARLHEACTADPELRKELESILAGEEDAFAHFRQLMRALPAYAPLALDNQDDPYSLSGAFVSHYEILEKLGGGGMGVVYKAFDTRLKRTVALKFLPLLWSQNTRAKQRFIAEAQAASALDHPNLCTIHEIGETRKGQLFIAMAYYQGETLKKKIVRGPLSVAETLDYAVQITWGLSKAHAHGIVHRDIKPANVMVTTDGVVKIVDFGLAKVADVSMTQTGATLGTVAYMSPEQASSEEVDARTDVWSLGVMLYEMLTGERPFTGDHEQAVIHAVLNEDFTPLRQRKAHVPSYLEHVVQKCLEKDLRLRYQAVSDLQEALEAFQLQRYSADVSVQGARGSESDQAQRHHLFISYKRDVDPDQAVALELYRALGRHHDVFVDQTMPVGTRWVEQIEAAMRGADFLIVLLSERSVHSEMVVGELEMARRFAKERGGYPIILPVRIAYQESFSYPLSLFLNGIKWASWETEKDTPRLIEQLRDAIAGGGAISAMLSSSPPHRPGKRAAIPAPQAVAQPPPRLELPEGTMDPQSAFYVERPEDRLAVSAVELPGVTITIKGPRQIGKSSLLMRTMAAAARAGKRVVFLDFQLFEDQALNDAEVFFRQLCAWIADELDMEDELEEVWRRPLGNSQRCTRYVGKYLLKELEAPLFLAMDEVERVFDTAFRSDFFSMLRSWHNDRAFKPRWRQLDLALVTSTEPYQLIENLNQSPFNVGEVVEVTDFTMEQVSDLNRKHGAPLSPDDVRQLMQLVGGHPYLTRRALYLVASQRIPMADLLAKATEDRGPFGDHLRYHLFRLYGHDDLIQGLRQVLHHRTCSDESIFWRLQGAGLVRREGPRCVPRCKLYGDYLRGRLDG